jgi:hypothetical protein
MFKTQITEQERRMVMSEKTTKDLKGNKEKRPVRKEITRRCRGNKKCKVLLFDVNDGQVKITNKQSDHLYTLRYIVRFFKVGKICVPQIIPVVEHSSISGASVDIRKYTDFFARFSCETPNDPACCEFRQYVKGGFYLWGIRIPTPMNNGRSLDPKVWQEDGMNGKRYGHRSDPNNPPLDVYTMDRANGWKYSGRDAPGMSCIRPGTPYKIELHFKDFILDTCRQIVEKDNIRFWDMVAEGTA